MLAVKTSQSLLPVEIGKLHFLGSAFLRRYTAIEPSGITPCKASSIGSKRGVCNADAPKSNIIIAHAGREPAVLPVSCSLPQLPESPRSPFAAQLKPTSSLESSSSSRQSDSRFEGHLLAGRGSVEPRSVSSAEAFDEVPLQCTQVNTSKACLETWHLRFRGVSHLFSLVESLQGKSWLCLWMAIAWHSEMHLLNCTSHKVISDESKFAMVFFAERGSE